MSERAPAVSRVSGAVARVLANTPLCHRHVAIELCVPAFPASQPGQFVQLLCRPAEQPFPRRIDWPVGGFPSLAGGAEWTDRVAFLRRPFSIADRWDDDAGCTHLTIISRNVGPGTAWLERLAPGNALNITGPLGHGFEVPPSPLPIILAGGGVGIPPLLYAARHLHDRGFRDVSVVFGATTGELLPVRLLSAPARDGRPRPCVALPGGARYPATVMTDDGSLGMPGLVTDGLALWRARPSGPAASDALVLACGPEGMLKAVAAWTRACGLRCQLCIERTMGCGLGTCLSCVVRVRDAARAGGWRWALACTEGPVFERDVLIDVGCAPPPIGN